MKKILLSSLLLLTIFILSSCEDITTSSDLPDDVFDVETPTVDDEDSTQIITTYDTSITISETTIVSSVSEAVSISDQVITISHEGTYELSGTSTNVSIYIDATSDETITLVFNGIDLSSNQGPIINVENAKKVIINLVENTLNTLTDLSTTAYDQNSVIYAKDDLTINGLGSLEINASYQKGIKVNDNLVIVDATISIDSKDHGIKVNNTLILQDVNLTILALGDGIKSENDEDTSLSLVYIYGGTYNITSYGDAISSSYDLTIEDGDFTIISGYNNTSSTESSKGLKASNNLYLMDGTYDITSKDDALHANQGLIIYDGTYDLSSNDDGIHADVSIEIQNGIINIEKSYEGIESSEIYISGGQLSITSSDDGINGSSGTTTSLFQMDASDGSIVQISGGLIYINAGGDGLDSNGDAIMSDGTVLIAGPTDNGNGAIDYNGSFKLTGGLLIAAGSSGMAENVSQSSIVSVKIGLSTSTSSIFQLKDASGLVIATFAPGKTYNSIVIASQDLEVGTTYQLYIGGSITSYDEVYHGFYTNALLSNQSLSLSFTISQTISTSGSTSSINTGPTRP